MEVPETCWKTDFRSSRFALNEPRKTMIAQKAISASLCTRRTRTWRSSRTSPLALFFPRRRRLRPSNLFDFSLGRQFRHCLSLSCRMNLLFTRKQLSLIFNRQSRRSSSRFPNTDLVYQLLIYLQKSSARGKYKTI